MAMSFNRIHFYASGNQYQYFCTAMQNCILSLHLIYLQGLTIDQSYLNLIGSYNFPKPVHFAPLKLSSGDIERLKTIETWKHPSLVRSVPRKM